MYSKKKRMQSLTKSLQNNRTPVLSTDDRVRMLQRKLYLRAKQSKTFKFYVLYDKISLEYFLYEAYRRVKANGGAPGVDGVNFGAIEKEGLPVFIKNLRNELLGKTYKASAVRRVYIPKANGKMRPLGIPTIKDRVVQMSVKMVIEPVFEADFSESSFGFRPKRSAKDAMGKIKEHLKEKRTKVFDADLEAYFDTIPHDKLMIAVKERIADTGILTLIMQWLKCPIIDGETKRTTGGKNNHSGTPQGGVISPLLSNIYLNLLDRIIDNPKSLFAKEGVRIVRYADDFILVSKSNLHRSVTYLESILTRMGLRLNKEKSSMKNARVETLDFLGFTIRNARTPYKGALNFFWNIHPSKKAEKKMRVNIKEVVRTALHLKIPEWVGKLNQKLRGWVNYYKIDGVSQMITSVSRIAGYLGQTIYRMIRRKSQNGWSRRYRQFVYKKFIQRHGLINLYQCINK
jgi:RNA-directed DNA polymerase